MKNFIFLFFLVALIASPVFLVLATEDNNFIYLEFICLPVAYFFGIYKYNKPLKP